MWHFEVPGHAMAINPGVRPVALGKFLDQVFAFARIRTEDKIWKSYSWGVMIIQMQSVQSGLVAREAKGYEQGLCASHTNFYSGPLC